MTFDRQTVKDTRRRLRTHLDALAADLGCRIEIGSASFDSDGSNCTFRIECAVIGEDGEAQTREATDFGRYAERFGLKPDDFGRSFTDAKGNTFTVVGCKPRSYRYPILGRRQDGKVYKLTADKVRRGLNGDAAAVPEGAGWSEPLD